MNLYAFDPTTKAFTGMQVIPDQVVLEGEEAPALPANTTTVPMLEYKHGFAQVFDGTEWAYAQIVYSKVDASEIMLAPGAIIPTTATVRARGNPTFIWSEQAVSWMAPPLTLEQVQALRLTAYQQESDHLKTEADYNGAVTKTTPDYTVWIAAVKAIKAKYPKPGATV